MMRAPIHLRVLGSPAPKGSGRAINVGGKARFVPGGSGAGAKRERQWATAVREAVFVWCDGQFPEAPRCVGAVVVTITFRVTRPTGHFTPKGALRKSAPHYPTKKPDLDKLARSTLDALTGSILKDDAQVVSLVAYKRYAKAGDEGADISIAEYEEP